MSETTTTNPTGANYLTDLSTILDAYAKNSGAGRALQGGLQNQQDQNKVTLFNALQGAARDAAGYQLGAPTKIAQQAVRGDAIANGQDASFSGLPSYIKVPTTTGGLRPSMLSGTTRQMGSNLTRDAMLAQMNGEATGYKLPGAPTAPSLTPLPDPSLLDQLAAGGGLASGLLGALKGSGGPGSGASGDIGKLVSQLFGRKNPSNPYGDTTYSGNNPFGSNLPGYDEYAYNDPTNGVGGATMPTDPSGGTGIGPGMAAYYAALLGGGDPNPSDSYDSSDE